MGQNYKNVRRWHDDLKILREENSDLTKNKQHNTKLARIPYTGNVLHIHTIILKHTFTNNQTLDFQFVSKKKNQTLEIVSCQCHYLSSLTSTKVVFYLFCVLFLVDVFLSTII